jgi:hypothetical protein
MAYNKPLQQWLQHPAFDHYWQKMIPFKNGAKINIQFDNNGIL